VSIYAVNGKEPRAVWIPSLDTTGNGTTTLTDLSGNGYSGTLQGMNAATDWVADTDAGGVRALLFQTGTNRVEFSMPSFGSGDFFVSLWIKPSMLTGYRMWFSSADLYWYFASENTSGAYDTSSNGTFRAGTIALNTWQHVIASRVSGVGRITINGVSQGTKADTYNQTSTSFAIGAWRYNTSNFFQGRIDDVRAFAATFAEADGTYLSQSRGIVAAGGKKRPRINGGLINSGLCRSMT
jgi:hypothetical protein